MKPVAGSCQRCWSAARASRPAPASARARSVDIVRPNAPERRPRRVAVGLASPRSILLIIALDTPERSARSDNDQPRASRSKAILAANDCVGSSGSLTIVDIILLYETTPSCATWSSHAYSRCHDRGCPGDPSHLQRCRGQHDRYLRRACLNTRGAAGVVRRPARQGFSGVGWGARWRGGGLLHLW